MSPGFVLTVLSQDPHFLLHDCPNSLFPFQPHRYLAKDLDLLSLLQLSNSPFWNTYAINYLPILDLDINTPPGPSLQSNKYSPKGLRASSLLSLPPFILEKIERQSWAKQAWWECVLFPEGTTHLHPRAPSCCSPETPVMRPKAPLHASKASPRLTFSYVSLHNNKMYFMYNSSPTHPNFQKGFF